MGKSLFYGIKNYFQALKIYNQALKINYQTMKIYFQALKIIISAVLACFFLSIPMFCYKGAQGHHRRKRVKGRITCRKLAGIGKKQYLCRRY